jgi:hypothetical protein
MQMDAEYKKQIGTLWEHWKGIWGVGGPSGESTLKSGHAFHKLKINTLLNDDWFLPQARPSEPNRP